MKPTILILSAIFIVGGSAIAQNHLGKQIRGIWRVAEITTTGNDAGEVADPQPGLIIFGKKYYSMTYVSSDKERPIYAAAAPTTAEKLAAFDSIIVNAGTYEISGKTLTVRPTVARNPGFTGGGFATYQISIDGKTLWLTNKNSDFNFRVGSKIVPLGGPSSETRMKLIRLE